MGEWQPGGSAIGVETPDVNAEYARVTAIDGVTTTEPMGGEGPVPRMFSIVDSDGSHTWVVQAAAERRRLRRGAALVVAPADGTPCGETTGSRVNRNWSLVVSPQHDYLAERRATANADMRLVARAIRAGGTDEDQSECRRRVASRSSSVAASVRHRQ